MSGVGAAAAAAGDLSGGSEVSGGSGAGTGASALAAAAPSPARRALDGSSLAALDEAPIAPHEMEVR
jgi:hypothetical protein